MLLAVDIGNTHIVLGCMRGLEIVRMARITTDKQKTEFEYAADILRFFDFFRLDTSALDGAIIASVVPPVTSSIAKAVKLSVGLTPTVVGKGVKTGVNILIDDPATMGAGIVAAAAGALKLYRPPLIVIDMSTATTISVLDKTGALIGGTISPGVSLSIAALSSGTSQLPNISLEPPARVIGANTVDSMRSGSVIAAAAMLDGMTQRIEEELGCRATAVATGSIAHSVVPLCRRRIEINENLPLIGLAVIYEKNRRNA